MPTESLRASHRPLEGERRAASMMVLQPLWPLHFFG